MKLKRAIIGVILACLAAWLVMPAAAGKDYRADRYDVTWDIQEDGSLRVSESVTFRFEGGPFTYVYRDLPLDYSDGISDLRASLDGAALPPGAGPGQVEITGDDPIRVTWHFDPVSDQLHTYGLTYRVLGVVRQEADADLLFWHALPTDYEYDIAAATLTVNYPAGLSPLTAPEVRRGRAEVSQEPGRVRFTAGDLRDGAELLIALRFAPGSLISTPPQWQVQAARAQAAAPAWAGAALAVLLAGLAGLWAYAARWRRPGGQRAAPFRPSEPPGDLPPAVVGLLTVAGGQAAWTHGLAALFSLAQRGVLRIDEAGEQKWYRSREFTVSLVARPSDLRPHESGLLDLIFVTNKGAASSVKFSELSSRVASQFKRFKAPLEQELLDAGLFDPARLRLRSRYLVLGLLLLLLSVIAVVLAALLASRFSGWPFLIPLSLFLLSMAALIASAAVSPLSAAGSDLGRQWQGFADYLRDVTRGREPAYDPRTFERYLPFAATFGLAAPWAKALSKQANAVIPAWFGALAGANDGGMTAFVAMTAASHSAGSSSSGGGGGGAGGGGGSGAG